MPYVAPFPVYSEILVEIVTSPILTYPTSIWRPFRVTPLAFRPDLWY